MKTSNFLLWHFLFLSYFGISQDLPKTSSPRWAIHSDLLSNVRGNSAINVGVSRFNGKIQEELGLDLFYNSQILTSYFGYKITPLRSFQVSYARNFYRNLDYSKTRNKYMGFELSAMTAGYKDPEQVYNENGAWKYAYPGYSGPTEPIIKINHLRFRFLFLKGSTYKLSEKWFLNFSGAIGFVVSNNSGTINWNYNSQNNPIFDFSGLEKIANFITHHSYVDFDSGTNFGVVFQLRLKVGYYIY